MFRKVIVPILSVVGFVFAIYVVMRGSRVTPAAQPVTQPAIADFATRVAGAGIIEASTENIAISTPLPGLVTEVMVKVGDKVKAGAPLFQLDNRDLQATLVVRQAALESAREKLMRLQNLPRPEDIPPAEARGKAADAALADAKDQLKMWEELPDKRAVSQEEINRRRFAVLVADAKQLEAAANLALLKAGTWKRDIEIAKSDVASAEAQVKETQISMDRLIVRAPVDGELLQVKIHAGEYATTGALATPLILMGGTDQLNVRVDVDENDASRIRPGARATGSIRGDSRLKTNLDFVRIEKYVVPKRSLTGDSTERVDTRVLQVIYSFPSGALPNVYPGQQMDVSIETGEPTTQP